MEFKVFNLEEMKEIHEDCRLHRPAPDVEGVITRKSAYDHTNRYVLQKAITAIDAAISKTIVEGEFEVSLQWRGDVVRNHDSEASNKIRKAYLKKLKTYYGDHLGYVFEILDEEDYDEFYISWHDAVQEKKEDDD